MKIASVDPGENTGVILYESRKRTLVDVFTVSISEAYSRVVEFEPETLIIEDQPSHSDLSSREFFIFTLFLNDFASVVINPGTWKPIAKARNWKSILPDQHTKDAYNLLRYWYFSVAKEDIGDVIWIECNLYLE